MSIQGWWDTQVKGKNPTLSKIKIPIPGFFVRSDIRLDGQTNRCRRFICWFGRVDESPHGQDGLRGRALDLLLVLALGDLAEEVADGSSRLRSFPRSRMITW